MEDDSQKKLGTMARAAILAQDKINDIKKRLVLITTTAKKAELEAELSTLEEEQSIRLSETKRYGQKVENLFTRRPCFVQV